MGLGKRISLFILSFCILGAGLWGQSRMPSGNNWLSSGGGAGRGDQDNVNVIFFEVDDSLVSPLYFAVLDPGANDSTGTGGIVEDQGLDTAVTFTYFDVVGGTGTYTGTNAKAFEYTGATPVDRGLAAYTGGSQLASINTDTTGPTPPSDAWVYINAGNPIYPSQGEHIGSKYYFKVVVYRSDNSDPKDGYRLDLSLSDSGTPTGIGGVRSFAYNVCFIISPGESFDFYPFVPENEESKSIIFQNFDFDTSDGGVDLTSEIWNLQGVSQGAAVLSDQDDVVGPTTLPIDLANTIGTWRFNVTDTTAADTYTNMSEVWFTNNDATPLPYRFYSSFYQPELPQYVSMNLADGNLLSDNIDTERITLQLMDVFDQPVEYQRTVFLDFGSSEIGVASSSGTVTPSGTGVILTTDAEGLFWLDIVTTSGTPDSLTANLNLSILADGSGSLDRLPANIVVPLGINDNAVLNVTPSTNIPPAFSSPGYTFPAGTSSFGTFSLTFTELQTGHITAANDIYVRVPDSLDVRFDQTDLSYSVSGVSAKINAVPSFISSGKILHIDVLVDFDDNGVAADDTITISDITILTSEIASSGELEFSYSGLSGPYNVVDTSSLVVESSGIYVWAGNSDSLWNNPVNWSGGVPPDAVDSNVVISTVGSQPTFGPSQNIGNLTINAGSVLTLPATTVLTVNGAVNNNGTLLFVDNMSTQLAGYSAGSNLGNVELTTATGTIPAGSVFEDLVLTSGNWTMSGNMQVNGDFTISAGSTLDLGGNVLTVSGSMDIQGTLGNGSINVTANPYYLTGDITTGNIQLTFSNPVIALNNAVINTGTADLRFDSTLDGNYQIELVSTGTIYTVGDMGSSIPLSQLTVTGNLVTSANVTTNGNTQYYNGNYNLTADLTLTDSDPGGGIFFTGTVDDAEGDGANSHLTLITTAASSTLEISGIVGGLRPLSALTLDAENILDINNNISLVGNFTQINRTNTAVDCQGTITSGGNISFGSDVSLTGTTALSASSGGISLQNIDGNADLSLTVGGGGLTVTAIGAGTPVANLTLNGPSFAATPAITAGTSISITSDAGIDITNVLTAPGISLKAASNIADSASILTSGGTLTLDVEGSSVLDEAGNGIATLIIADADGDGSGALTYSNAGALSLQMTGGSNESDSLTLSGDITLGSNYTVSGGILNNGIFRSGTNTLTVGGNFDTSGGTFNPGSGAGTVVFNGTSTFTSDGLVGTTDFNHLTLNGTSLGFGSNNIVVAGNLTITAGALTAPAALSVGGNWTNGGTFTHSGGTVTFTGPGDIVSGGTSFSGLAISGGARTTSVPLSAVSLSITGGSLALAAQNMGVTGAISNSGTLSQTTGTLTVGGNFDTSSGAFDPGAGTVIFNGTSTFTSNGLVGTTDFNHLTLNGTSLGFGSSNIVATGNLTITAGALTAPAALSVRGNWTNGGTFTHSGGTVTFTGPGDIVSGGTSFSGLAISGGARTTSVPLSAASLSITGGSLALAAQNMGVTGAISNSGTLSQTTGTLTVGGNFDTSSGAFDPGAGTVIFNGTSTFTSNGLVGTTDFNHLTLNGTSLGFGSNNIVAAGNLTITAGALTAPAALSVGGNWTNGGTFTHSGGTVTFTGPGDIVSGGTSFSGLAISGGARTTSVPLSAASLSITGGSLALAAQNMGVTGVISNSGSLSQTTGTLTVGGNFDTSSGAFDPGTGTVAFNGTSTFTSDGLVGTTDFNNLTLNGTSLGFGSSNIVATGNLTITAGALTAPAALSVRGNWTNGGTFTHSGGTVTFTGPGDIVSGGTSFSGLAISGGARTTSVPLSAASLSITGGSLALAAQNMGVTGAISNSGTLSQTTGTLTVGGNFDTSSGAFDPGTGSVVFNGTSTFTSNGSGGTTDFNNLTLNGTSLGFGSSNIVATGNLTITAGALTAPAALSVGGNWTNGGTFTHSGGTVTMTGGAASVTLSSASSFNNLVINQAGKTVDFNSAITVSNDMTATAGTVTQDLTLAVGNNLLINGGTVNQSATQTITGNLTISSGTLDQQGQIDVTGNLSISGTGSLVVTGAQATNVGGNFNHTAGTFTAGAGTVTMTGASSDVSISSTSTFNNLTIDNSGYIVLAGSTISVSNNLNVTAGTLNLASNSLGVTNAFTNNDIVSLAGTQIVTVGSYTDSGTTIYNSAAGATSLVLGDSYHNLVFQTNGDWTLDAPLSIGGNLNASGANTISPGTNSVTFTGSGTYTPPSSGSANFTFSDLIIDTGAALTAGGNINISGNWTNNVGTTGFTAGGSTLTFTGSGTSTISGNNTFNNLSCTIAGKTLSIATGTTQTIASGGTLTITGTNALNLVTLSSPAVSGSLDITNAAGVSFNFAIIENIHLIPLTPLLAVSNCIDGSGNAGFNFGPNSFNWTGLGGNSNWQNPANWNWGYWPGPTDNVTIGISGNDPVLEVSPAVNNFIVNDNLNLNGQTLAVNGTLAHNSTITDSGTGSLSVTGTSSLAGGITAGGTLTFSNAVTVTADSTLSAGTLNFGSTVNSNASNTNTLGLTIGAGGLSAASGIGTGTPLATVTLSGPAFTATPAITTGTSISITSAGALTVTQPLTSTGGIIALNSTGTLALNGAVSTGTLGGRISLDSGAGNAITQSAILTSASLQITNSGAVTLGLGNNIGTLAANAASISYNDADALTLGTVNGTSGVTTSSGALAVSNSAGVLTISQNVNTTGGTVDLTGIGGISSTGTYNIVSSGQNITLNNDLTVTGTGQTLTISTGAASGVTGDISLANVYTGTNQENNLSLETGDGGYTFGGVIGTGASRFNTVLIRNNLGITATPEIYAFNSITIGSGGNVTVSNALNSTNSVSLTGDNLLDNASGIITCASLGLTLNIPAGTILLDSAQNAASVIISSSVSSLDYTTDIDANINLGNSLVTNVTLRSTSDIFNQFVSPNGIGGSLTVTSGTTLAVGTTTLNVGGGVNNAGTLTLTSGTLSVTGGITNSGTLAMTTGTGTLNVGGNFDNTGGIFNPATGTVVFNGTGAQTFTSDGETATSASDFNHLQLSGSGLGFSSSPIAVAGNLTITSGTLTAPANFSVAGSWTNGDTFTHNSGTVTFTGAGDIVSGGTSFNNVIFSGGARTTSTDLTAANNLTISGGSLNASDDTVTIGNALSLTGGDLTQSTSGSLSAGSLSISNTNSQMTANRPVSVAGNVSISAGSYSGSGSLTTTTSGNLAISSTGSLTSTGAITVAGDLSVSGSGDFTPTNTVGITGTSSFSASGTMSLGNTFTSGGLMTVSGGSLTIADTVVVNANGGLTLSGGIVDPVNAGSIEINGDLSLDSGTLNGNARTINLSGNWNNTGGIFTHGTSIVILDGASNVNLSPGGTGDNFDFYDLTLSPAAASTVNLQTDMQVRHNITIGVNATLDSLTSDIVVGGNWTQLNNFTSGSNSVTFSSLLASVITGGTDFYQVNITGGTTTTGSALIANGISISGGSLNASGDSVSVGAGGFSISAGSYLGSGSLTTTASGNLAITSTGSLTSTGAITVAGGLSVAGTGDFTPTNTVGITGTSSFSATGTMTLGNTFTSGGLMTVSGGLLTAGNTAPVTASNGLAVSGGTFTANSTVGVTNGVSLSNAATLTANNTLTASGGLSISGTATLNGTGNLDINGNLSLTGGTLTGGARTINLSGNWTNNGSAVFDSGTSTVILDGNVASTTLNSGGSGANFDFYELRLQKDSAAHTVTLTGNPLSVLLDLIVPFCTLDTGGFNINVLRNVVLANPDLSLGSGRINANGSLITLGQNWTSNSTAADPFVHGTSTVAFTDAWTGAGNGPVTIANATDSFFNASFSDGADAGILSGELNVAGTLTVGSTYSNTAADAVLNLGSQNFTVAANQNNGRIQLTGAQGTQVFTDGIDSDSGWVEYTGATATLNNSTLASFWNLEISGGTYTLGQDINVLGTESSNYDDDGLFIRGGSLDAGTQRIEVWEAFDTTGGSFIANTGTLAFTGPVDSYIAVGQNFYNLEVDDTQGDVSGKNLFIEAGQRLSIENDITLVGDGTNPPNAADLPLIDKTEFCTTGDYLIIRSTPVSYPLPASENIVNTRQWYIERVNPTTTISTDNLLIYQSVVFPVTDTIQVDSETTYVHNLSCQGWIFENDILFTIAQDTNGNGKIDRIEVQVISDLRQTGNPFSNFIVEFSDGYELLSDDPALNFGFLTSKSFYINLKERPFLDTDATPVMNIVANTTLVDSITGNKEVVFSNYPDAATPRDFAQPVIGYTLAVPELNEIFIEFSEPVTSGASTLLAAGDFSLSGGLTISSVVPLDAVGSEGERFLIRLSNPLTINNILGQNVTVNAAVQDTAADWGSYTLPIGFSYPVIPRVMLPARSSHRLSDLALGPLSNAAIQPLWARDETLASATGGSGLIQDFDGSAFLKADTITLQAHAINGLTPALSGTVELHHLQNPASQNLRVVDGNTLSLWLSNLNGSGLSTGINADGTTADAFSGLVPFATDLAAERISGGVNNAANSQLWDFTIDGSLLENNQDLSFLFYLPNQNLFAARLPDETSPTWYNEITPFSFQIHEIVNQGGGVSVLHNIFNPYEGESVGLYYRLNKAGMVSIQVFDLAGGMVEILQRGRQEAGEYSISWNGRNRAGNLVARGVYFIRVVAPGIDEMRECMVIK